MSGARARVEGMLYMARPHVTSGVFGARILQCDSIMAHSKFVS